MRGYKSLLLGQISVLFIFLFVFELGQRYPFPNWEKYLLGTVSVIMLFLNILTYWLIKELTSSKLVQYFIVGLIWIGVSISVLIGLEFIDPQHEFYTESLILSFTCNIISYGLLLLYMLVDIFKEKHEISYRLWGSASIYLLYGALFGLIYSLLEILIPQEFMITVHLDIFRIVPCYTLSFYTLSGIDSAFENFSLLVTNLSVIEALFSNLFIVLVVGRILAK